MNAPSDVSELDAGSASGPGIEAAGEADPAAADPGSEDSGAGAEAATGAEGEPPDPATVIAERDAYLEDLQRVTAEFTNFRRQTMRRNT